MWTFHTIEDTDYISLFDASTYTNLTSSSTTPNPKPKLCLFVVHSCWFLAELEVTDHANHMDAPRSLAEPRLPFLLPLLAFADSIVVRKPLTNLLFKVLLGVNIAHTFSTLRYSKRLPQVIGSRVG